MPNKKHFLFITLLFISSISCAEVTLHKAIDKMTINGFMTGSLAISDHRNTALGRPSYDDITNQLSADSDNVGGIQFTIPVTDKMSGTVQFVAKGPNNYDAELAWAYIKYRPIPELSVEVGRYRLPVYLMSQYLDVGYAYSWIKPPLEIYSLAPIPNASGANFDYQLSLSENMVLHIQPFIGSGHQDIKGIGQTLNTTFKNIAGLSGELSNDWLTLHASFAQARFSFNNAVTVTVPPATVVTFPAVTNVKGMYWGVGARIDKYDWLVMTEYARRNILRSYLNSAKSAYLMVGHRFGNLTPHITIAGIRTTNRSAQTSVPAIGAVVAGAVQADQNSINLGARYDINANIALKGDITHIVLKNGTKGLFTLTPLRNVSNIFNVAINFVF